MKTKPEILSKRASVRIKLSNGLSKYASKNLKNLYKLALEMLQLLLTYLIDRLHKEIHPKKSHLSGNLLLYSSSHNFVSDVEAHWKNASRDE